MESSEGPGLRAPGEEPLPSLGSQAAGEWAGLPGFGVGLQPPGHTEGSAGKLGVDCIGTEGLHALGMWLGCSIQDVSTPLYCSLPGEVEPEQATTRAGASLCPPSVCSTVRPSSL